MTLTREQIEAWFRATGQVSQEMNTIRDLALAALEMRERAAKVCEAEKVDADATGDIADYAYNQAADHCAAAIRALPLTPELPTEQVPSQKGTDEPGGSGKPARAGEPRCARAGYFCHECNAPVPTSGCWKGRTAT